MKSPILGLALSTVAFGASSIYLWTQFEDQREQAEAVRQANGELTARVAELEKRRAELAAQIAASSGPGSIVAVNTGPAPTPATAAANSRSAEEGKPVWSVRDRNGAPPPPMPDAMLKMMRANMRAQNKRMYFDLQSKLGLTNEQTSDLLDLLTDQHTASFKAPRTQNPEDARKYWEADQARRKAAIEDLLGPAKAAQFADYQRTMPARSELMAISQQLEGMDTPLNDSQRSSLLDTLVQERDRIPMPTFSEGIPRDDMAKAYDDWQSDYEKRVADAARTILTTEQFNTYSEYQQWQREMRQQFAAQAPGGGPPVRMMRGGTFFAPAPAGAVGFSTSADGVSSDPTDKSSDSK